MKSSSRKLVTGLATLTAVVGMASVVAAAGPQSGLDQQQQQSPFKVFLPGLAADSAPGSAAPSPTGSPPPSASPTGTGTSTATTTTTTTATPTIVITPSMAPTAVNDAYSVVEDDVLVVAAPGILTNDSGSPSPQATVQTGPANGALTLNPDGSFTYTPNANFAGADEFLYTASNGVAPNALGRVSITVHPVDDAPLAVADSATTDQGSPVSINVLANDTDVDGGIKLVSSTSDPANGSVVITGGGAGVTYTPDAGYCNTPPGTVADTFTYTLTPGGSSAPVTVTVVCEDPPVAVGDSATVLEDAAPTAINVLANDTDTDGGPKNIASATQPANGTVVLTPAGGPFTGLTYQPDPNYCNSVSGIPDTFTYTLTPGSSTATVSVTVTCVIDNPTAVDDAATVNEDSGPTALDVLANEVNPDSVPTTVTSATQPANGTVVLTGGSPGAHTGLTYQPDTDYCNDPPGVTPDTFTYTLSPGGDTATVSVTVSCLQDNPTANDDTATVLEDAAATTIDVSANDTDPDGLGKQLTSATAPANGTVVLTPPGGPFTGLTYQPVPDYCNQPPGGAPDTFTYTLVHGGDTATVSVTVTCVNDAPSFSLPTPSHTSGEDAGAQTVPGFASASAGPANESGQTLSYVVTGNTNTALFSSAPAIAANGTLTYTAAPNRNGTATITVKVQDDGGIANGGVNESPAQTFTVTVTQVNDAPTAAAQNYAAQANMAVSIAAPGLLAGAADANDVAGNPGWVPTLTVANVSATSPAGGVIRNLNAATGSFDFEPPPGATGNVTFTYQVCDDGEGSPASQCSAAATVTVTVGGPVIWFVDDSAPAAGANGTLAHPFTTLAAADSVDAANQRIFLFSGTYSTGLVLNSGEWLIGQGVTGTTFDAVFGIAPPAGTVSRPAINGTRPAVQGSVVTAVNAAVRGLNIQPGPGTAGLTGSGATSLTVGEVSVTTTNAAAVNLASSGGTLSFTSISANGGSNGIVLNTTTGTFTVTGTGGTCAEAATGGCSGGTIQNMTGSDDSSATPVGTGIVLNNAAGVSLTRMYIHDHANYGIRGTAVNGFVLDSSVVNGANGTNVAAPFNDGSISFDNLSGTSAITNSAIAGGYQRNLRVDNTTGTLNLTVNGNSIHNTSDAAGDDGVLLEIGGGTATLTVTNNTFAAHGGDHLNVSLLGSPTVTFTFTGNLWTGGHPIGLGQGLFVLAAAFNAPGTLTYNISNNGTAGNPLVGNNSGGALHVNKGSGTGSFSGTISNNVIGNPAVNGSGSLNASGIDVEAHGSAGSHTVLISNNLVRQFHNDGILILAGEGNAAFNVTMTGNTVSDPDASLASFHGVHLNIGTLPTDAAQVCLDIRNNTLTNAANEANGGLDLRLRQRQLTTVRLPGYAGANNDNAAVQTFLTATNANALTSILASNTVAGGGGGFVGGAACALP